MSDEKHSQNGRIGWSMAMGEAGATARDRLVFWLVALLVGIVSGYTAIGFRLIIDQLHMTVYGADSLTLHSVAAGLNPWVVFFAPVIGGLCVGLILMRFTKHATALSVSDVIAASALHDARVNRKEGLASAAASLITLSTGGSSGREGPVVHLAAVISGWIAERINMHGVSARDILGCAVASAVSASFNAPIAGALFALEVVLRHYAPRAFAPIVIASVAGAVIARIHVGEVAEYALPVASLAFYEELPAFLILGVVSGLVAAILMRALFLSEDLATKAQTALNLPVWLRPTVAGAMLGLIAIWFPHIIGVGYETTSLALTGELTLGMAIGFAAVKAIAVAITYAGRMGGGVFSPALMMGAFTGLAFGSIAVSVFPEVSGSEGLYALAGMGAVAAAVLGAPISTTLIVFELTGDYQAAIAVMISVSLATVTAQRFVFRSFFLSQLMRTGVNIVDGVRFVPATVIVRRVMRPAIAEEVAGAKAMADQGFALTEATTMDTALKLFDQSHAGYLPVYEDNELVGVLDHVAALKAVNSALIRRAREQTG
jgi:CIC family chloride channel protein